MLEQAQARWLRLKSARYGLGTSEGAAFGNHLGTVFARDSALNAIDAVRQDPQLAHSVILTLASLQGTKKRRRSEEDPGKIHHEFRPLAKASFGQNVLALVWGGGRYGYTTYFAADTTALFILLVEAYVAVSGTSVLNETVTLNSGEEISIQQVVYRAAWWLIGQVDRYGLVATKRRNPAGLMNADWKDSPYAYPSDSRHQASYRHPKAYLEVQAWSADALEFVGRTSSDQSTKQLCFQVASHLRQAVFAIFWDSKQELFAPVVVLKPLGQWQQVAIAASNAGWLLETKLFDTLPDETAQGFISAIVRRLFSDDFLTPIGIRCRGLSAPRVPFADYHGDQTVWPVDVFRFARGLRKWGFNRLGSKLESRLIAAVDRAEEQWEFFFVSRRGEVLWQPLAAAAVKDPNALPVTWLPDRGQAWTVVEYLALVENWLPEPPIERRPWARSLDDEIADSLPGLPNLGSGQEVPFAVDRGKGTALLTRRVLAQYMSEYLPRR